MSLSKIMDRRAGSSRIVLALLLSLAAVAPQAARADAKTQVTWNQPAQDLAGALQKVARATDTTILFAPEDVAGKTAPALQGASDAASAVRTLLQGSGLTLDATGAVLTVRKPVGGAGATPIAVRPKPAPTEPPPERIVVTGSRLGPNTNVPIEVKTYSAARIAESGQTTLANFLNTLPEVSVQSRGAPVTVFGSYDTVRLRGLPSGSTSILLDGRRLAVSAAVNSFDLNLLPASMIERIDIIPVGGSAIYGSDAIGGVVNVVTKKKFDGADIETSYSFADGYDEKRVSFAAGHEIGRAWLSTFGTYSKRSGLYGYERPITADNNYARFAAQGGIEGRSQRCDPGNVSAASGTLSGLGTSSAAIPASGANLIANYRGGQTNFCNLSALSAQLPPMESYSLALDATWDVTDDLAAYFNGFASSTYNDGRRALAGVVGVLVPASNAFNPFGQPVRISAALPVASGTQVTSRLYRPLVGIRGTTWRDFEWSVEGWTTFVRDSMHEDGMTISALGTSMLAATSPSQALNLFTPTANSPDTLRQAFYFGEDLSRTRETATQALLRGSPFDLPAGALKMAAGTEFRHEHYSSRTYSAGNLTQLAWGEGKRNVAAGFFEVHAPVFARADGGELLSADAAGRYDQYSDFGGNFAPQFGVRFAPTADIALRATYAEAFRAPLLRQLWQSNLTSTSTGGLRDPKRNEATGTIAVLSGANQNLGPETGRSKTIGADWTPSSIEGLRVTATYWSVKEANRISTPGPSGIIANEDLFPTRVTRAPSINGRPGVITAVDARYVNYGGLILDGIDFGASYAIKTSWGVFTPSIDVTRTLSYRSQVTAGALFENRLSLAADSDAWAPRWKGVAGLSWSQPGITANFQGRYVGAYTDYQTVPNHNVIGNFTTFDASVQVDLGTLFKANSMFDGTRLRVGATNIFDRAPDYSNYALNGYDPSQYDLVGRQITITLGKRF